MTVVLADESPCFIVRDELLFAVLRDEPLPEVKGVGVSLRSVLQKYRAGGERTILNSGRFRQCIGACPGEIVRQLTGSNRMQRALRVAPSAVLKDVDGVALGFLDVSIPLAEVLSI